MRPKYAWAVERVSLKSRRVFHALHLVCAPLRAQLFPRNTVGTSLSTFSLLSEFDEQNGGVTATRAFRASPPSTIDALRARTKRNASTLDNTCLWAILTDKECLVTCQSSVVAWVKSEYPPLLSAPFGSIFALCRPSLFFYGEDLCMGGLCMGRHRFQFSVEINGPLYYCMIIPLAPYFFPSRLRGRRGPFKPAVTY